MSISWTKYIHHHEAEEYERLGWTIHKDDLAGTHHGVHSVIGTWRSADPDAIPPQPERPR